MHETADKPTILVVDDAPANIDLLKGILSGHYRVKAATSGERALKIAAKPPVPRLILLDVMMPGMDGHETCRRLKSDPLTAAIPIIFVSARLDETERAKGLALGAQGFIDKPVEPESLLARVAESISV